MAQQTDDEKVEGLLKRAQGEKEEIRPIIAVWAELASRVRDEKARIAALPPPPPPPPPIEEEPEESPREMTSEEQREWNEKLMRAGRYVRAIKRRRVFGVDRHIYHMIPRPLDRRVDKHLDTRLTLHKTHIIRRPVDRRIRRGRGLIEGVNPFRMMKTWRN